MALTIKDCVKYLTYSLSVIVLLLSNNTFWVCTANVCVFYVTCKIISALLDVYLMFSWTYLKFNLSEYIFGHVDPWLEHMDYIKKPTIMEQLAKKIQKKQTLDTINKLKDLYNKSIIPEDVTFLEIAGLLFVVYVGFLLFKCFIRRLRFLSWYMWTKLTVKWCFDTFAERMVTGSQMEFVRENPRFQVEIHVKRDGVFHKSGQGFSTQFGIFTALHVVEEANEVLVVGPTGEVKVEASRFLHLEGDVCLLKVTKELAKLGVSQGKLVEMVTSLKAGLIVKTQAYGQRSMGQLKPDEGFGLCVYEGSTIKGFSGSPYHVGNHIFGMHIGSSGVNMGYQAAYLYMLAKHFNEDTEDYLYDEIMNSEEEYQWQRSPVNPDEVRVQFKGKYFLVDRELIYKLRRAGHKKEYQEPNYEEEAYKSENDLDSVSSVGSLPLAPRGAFQYKDSKNLLKTPSLNVNVGVIGKESVQEDAAKSFVKALNVTDSKSRKVLESCLSDGLKQIPVLRNVLSNCMSEYTKVKQQKQLNQQKKKRTKRSLRRSTHTQPGNIQSPQETSTTGLKESLGKLC